MAKVWTIFKKGENEIKNYRPISNLGSTSKVFAKLILKLIMEIQVENKVNLTGTKQHGFRANKSATIAVSYSKQLK